MTNKLTLTEQKSGPAEAAKGQPMGHRTQKNLLIFGTSSVRISGSRRVFCRTAQNTHHATYHHTVYHTFPENARNKRFCTQKIGCQSRKSRGTAGKLMRQTPLEVLDAGSFIFLFCTSLISTLALPKERETFFPFLIADAVTQEKPISVELATTAQGQGLLLHQLPM